MSLHPAGPRLCLRTRQLPSSLSLARSFSSTIPNHTNGNVPPESPAYIRLPKPPQSEETSLPRVRGHLPVPRKIFPRVEGDRKLQPEYMAQTVPTRRDSHPRNETQVWKTRMARTRRENLGRGLQALWERKDRTHRARATRAAQNFEANRDALQAPEREDERLTRGTVLDSILDTETHPDPERWARHERAQRNVAEREKQKQEARRDALMELYLNATRFITHEKDLKAEVDEVFAEDYFRKQSHQVGREGGMENAWGVYGAPPSLAQMLHSTGGSSMRLIDTFESEYDRSVKRQKRLAEELTGGKME